MIDGDAAPGQQLLHLAVGQPVTQLPAHRHRNHLTRKTVAGRCRRGRLRIDHAHQSPQPGIARPTQQTRPGHRPVSAVWPRLLIGGVTARAGAGSLLSGSGRSGSRGC
jgi:hypothetical protein